MARFASAFILVLLAWPAAAWDGSDGSSGNSVEIEKGQTVRRGREVEFYDHGTGSYRTIDVDSVHRRGRGVEIEGTDSDGNSVTLDMDGRDE
ncbi:DUF5334 family protein [Methylorubrum aminovorans]